MLAVLKRSGEMVYNPSTGEFFKVKADQYLVVWEFIDREGNDQGILAISIPFTNPNSAEETVDRLNDLLSKPLKEE